MKIIKGNLIAENAKIAISISRFNNFITDSLLNGSIDILKRIGHIKDNNITVIWVPGAYELPLTVSLLAKKKKFDAIIALGTIIKGATSHFEFISSECSSCLASISVNSETPVVFGVLTTENIEQSIERAGTKFGNKGAEAALTALEMINILKLINV